MEEQLNQPQNTATKEQTTIIKTTEEVPEKKEPKVVETETTETVVTQES